VPDGFVPLSATFVSDRTGWVLGCVDSCFDGRGGYVVVRTHDAGRTWRALPAPPAPLRTLVGLRFANLGDGFAYGDRIWATHDGGATWRAHATGGLQVVALEAARGRAWSLVEEGAAGTVFASLFRTPVAGGQWSRVRGLHRTGGDVPQLVLQGAWQLLTTDGGSAAVHLLVGNGGSFLQRVLPCGPEQPFVNLAAQSSQRLLVVCHRGDGNAGQEPKSAWTSVDQGRTWTRAADPEQRFPTSAAASPDALFVSGGEVVQVSRDRGRHWTGSLECPGVLQVGFESATLGFVIDDGDPGAMHLTHDDGRTWQTVDFRRTAGS
jgi:photosystem II stability/assembly factor-like uncharacterized protein